MRRFGLLLQRPMPSFSPEYFRRKWAALGVVDCCYDVLPLADLQAFRAWDAAHACAGFNVTHPYKEGLFPFLSACDTLALEVGAVNTVRRMPDGSLYGYNTDVEGFDRSFGSWYLGSERRAVVFGSGGAAKAVMAVLLKRGFTVLVVTRSGEARADKRADKRLVWVDYPTFAQSAWPEIPLWIQATPIGMAPQSSACLDLPFDRLGPQHWCYDLVYNPEESLFLRRAREQGALTKNGLEMLHLQADAAWRLWST